MFLGIDLGTSGVKVLLIDNAQKIIASTTQSLSVSRPKPLWSEQNPLDWWQATQVAVHELKRNHEKMLSHVRAIGLSGQMHGATLLNKNNHPLRPAILWNDGRSMTQCQTLLKRVPKASLITGNLIMPGFTAPKLLWVKENESSTFEQIKKVLLPKDYLRFCITGDFATDMSDASGTVWLDVEKRRWSDTLIHATDLTIQQMPTLFEGTEITGTVTTEIAKTWGIPPHTVVVGGGGDNAASAISMSIIKSGDAFLSLGTSGVYFVTDDKFRPNPQTGMHTMCHCLPALWHEMNVHLSAASCLNWAAKIIGKPDIDVFINTAENYNPVYTPIFLPYLSGERTPHNDPYARGVFFNMGYDTGPAEIAQAVLEGAALAIADGQHAMQAAGIKINEVSVVGGGARSAYWGNILASALQRPLIYRQQAEVGGAYGAARLAWLAIHGGNPEDVFPIPKITHIIEPNEIGVQRYEKLLPLFRELYKQLKVLFYRSSH